MTHVSCVTFTDYRSTSIVARARKKARFSIQACEAIDAIVLKDTFGDEEDVGNRSNLSITARFRRGSVLSVLLSTARFDSDQD